MKCLYCGKENRGENAFCAFCGGKLTEDKPADMEPIEEPASTQPFVLTLTKRNLIVFTGIASVILITVVVMLILLLGPKNRKVEPVGLEDPVNSSESSGETTDSEGSDALTVPESQTPSQAEGNGTPQVTSNTQPEMKDKPVFIGYKNVGEPFRKVQQSVSPKITRLSLSAGTGAIQWLANPVTEVPYNTSASVQLEYTNPSRDLILDILIDDSIAGRNCVYSTDSSRYQIANIDTVWNESRSTFISTVTLVIPPVASVQNRTITIRETSFLRNRIEGKADFDANAVRTIEFKSDALGDSLKTVENDDGTLTITGYSGSAHELIIPSVYMEKTVTKIADRAFSEAGFAAVSIPESVVEMGHYVFENCANLKKVDLTYSKDRKIGGKGMFKNCKALETIDFSPFFLGDTAEMFMGCTALKTVTADMDTLNMKVGTEIRKDAFKDCTSLVSVDIPTQEVTVLASAFENCTSLQTLNFLHYPTFKMDALKGCDHVTITAEWGIRKENDAVFEGQDIQLDIKR